MDGRHPVVNVSWADAVAFCDYLESAEGDECRLPTEAEWEYACQLGTIGLSAAAPESLHPWANVADQSLANKWPKVASDSISAWDDGYPFTVPVGQFKPGTLGLYDMRGNAWEWCQDWHDRIYYERSPRSDPSGPASGSARVCRGGSWYQPALACRSALRNARPPSDRHATIGFRVIQVW